jgi:hypothetical protein
VERPRLAEPSGYKQRARFSGICERSDGFAGAAAAGLGRMGCFVLQFHRGAVRLPFEFAWDWRVDDLVDVIAGKLSGAEADFSSSANCGLPNFSRTSCTASDSDAANRSRAIVS